MKEFDYIIIGGGCAGLSLAYELEIHNKLENKTLAIIEPRDEYKRDKTWSFWRVSEHNFDDCVIKNWKNFSVNAANKTHLYSIAFLLSKKTLEIYGNTFVELK
jgi:lycopene beta-cyclase